MEDPVIYCLLKNNQRRRGWKIGDGIFLLSLGKQAAGDAESLSS